MVAVPRPIGPELLSAGVTMVTVGGRFPAGIDLMFRIMLLADRGTSSTKNVNGSNVPSAHFSANVPSA